MYKTLYMSIYQLKFISAISYVAFDGTQSSKLDKHQPFLSEKQVGQSNKNIFGAVHQIMCGFCGIISYHQTTEKYSFKYSC